MSERQTETRREMAFSSSSVTSSHSPAGGQFKATKMWKDLVHHLYENANVKRRRVLMRSHGDCFSGGNAVDTLLSYVQRNPNKFPNTSAVTRENIVRLLQSFIDADVFECVNAGEDSEKKARFEDSSSRLYRFDQEYKQEFMRGVVFRKSSQSLNVETAHSVTSKVEHLPAKFSSLLTATRSTEPAPRRKIFSPFCNHRRQKSLSSSQTSDSDCENQRPASRGTMKLKRTGSLELAMKRSSSDSNLRKQASTSSESDSKRGSPGGGLSRTRLRLSQRLSFRKKSLRHFDHSSHSLQQPCVIQNYAAAQVDSQGDSTRQNDEVVDPDSDANNVAIADGKPIKRKLSRQEISHVKRESVRVRLLQIFDVSFIETLIISPTYDKKTRTSSWTENFQMNRHGGMQYSEVAASYDNDDPWISGCLSVLRHIPDSYNILKNHARSAEHKKKAELYFAIAGHYNSLQRPLIDENYNGIAQGIVTLLATKPVEETMEATQLFVHLLPDAKLTELRRLCEFLHAVCTENEAAKRTSCNQALAIETFTPAILRLPVSVSSESDLDGCQGLVRFMVQHRLLVFTLPMATEMIIRKKIEILEQGLVESPSLISGTTYCTIISRADYQTQRVTHTLSEVRGLYGQIQTSSSMTLKKKKELLKEMRRHYPDVFDTTAEKFPDDKAADRSLVQRTRLLFNLSRPQQQRKLCAADSSADNSATNDPRISRTGSARNRSTPAQSVCSPSPNSDPSLRKRTNSAQARSPVCNI